MKTKKMLISIGIILGFAGLCFAKGTEAIGTNTIEPKLVMEYKFDEPVVDVIFDSATMTVKEAMALGMRGLEKRKATEKVKVQYPKVVFEVDPKDITFRKNEQIEKEIKFYDKQGSMINRIKIDSEKNEKVSTSQNKEYFTVWKDPTEDNPETGGALYKSDGRLIWRKDKDPSPITVSDEGYVVAGELDWEMYPPQDFVFYDPAGNELGRVKNPYKDITAGVGYAQFSRSGEYVLVGYCCFSKTTIILATKKGKILWQKELEYCSWIPTDGSDFVENVGIVGIGSSDKSYTYFIDWNGNLKWTVPLDRAGDMIVKLSEDNKKVFITTSSGYVWCIEVPIGKILWKHKEDWTKYIEIAEEKLLLKDKDREGWKSYVSSPDRYDLKFLPYFCEMEVTNEYICVIGKYMKWSGEDAGLWKSSRLYVFDFENGSLIQKIEYPNKRISFQTTKDKIFILDFDERKIIPFETKGVSK